MPCPHAGEPRWGQTCSSSPIFLSEALSEFCYDLLHDGEGGPRQASGGDNPELAPMGMGGAWWAGPRREEGHLGEGEAHGALDRTMK